MTAPTAGEASSTSISLADPEVEELSSRIRGGLRWKFFSEGTILVSRVLVAIVLAHLLSPHDFGVAGMVLVVANLVATFADIGVGNALVQRRKIDDGDRSTMFWISMAAGSFFTLAGIGLSFALASFYGEPQVQPLFVVFSFAFVLTSIGATQRTLLYRAMDFRRLELRNVAGILAGAVVGVVVAVLGFGPWALIAQSLTLIIVSTILLWLLVPWRPRFVFVPHVAWQLGSFGLRSLGASIFSMSNQITDKILVGRFLGASALGVYGLAFNTVLMPLSRIVVPIGQVFYPAISRLQDDYAGVGRTWLKMNRVVIAVFAPLMLSILITAPDLVPVVFGEKWKEAIPVLQILAAGSLVQALQGLNPSVLQAVGRPALALRFSVVTFVVSLGAYVIGLHWGIIGVATGFAVANGLLAIAYGALTARIIHVGARAILKSQAGVAEASAAMAAAMLIVGHVLLSDVSSHVVRVLVVLVAGVAVYALALLWREPALVADARRFAFGRSSTTS